MAKDTKRVTIGDSQYIITQLGAVAGRLLSKRFVDAMVPVLRDVVCGPALGELQKAVSSLPDEANVEQSILAMLPVIGPPLLDAVRALPNQLFEELCQAFSESCKVMAGKPATPQPLDGLFDDHFAGNYLEMYGWFFRCLVVNGFLANLGAAAKAASTAATA